MKKNRKEYLNEKEITDSIKSNFESVAPSEYIVDAIKKHHALYKNKHFHYKDISKKYHLCREFKLKQTIADGTETFFEKICEAMAKKVNFDDISLVLYLQKDTNGLFANELAKNHIGGIKSHPIMYSEKRGMFKRLFSKNVKRNFDYQIGESLSGLNVILIESLLIFPETVLSTIQWLKSKGANVKNVVILFDATEKITDFESCEEELKNGIMKGVDIDLKSSSVSNCECKDKVRLKVIKYDKY